MPHSKPIAKGQKCYYACSWKNIGENVKYWAVLILLIALRKAALRRILKRLSLQLPPPQYSLPLQKGPWNSQWFCFGHDGYQPNFSLLEQLGVRFHQDVDRTPVYDATTMESNVPGVYLAGVVCGGLKTNKWFIENSREHAPLIMQDIQAKVAAATQN